MKYLLNGTKKMNRINVKPDPKLIEKHVKKLLRRLDPPRAEKKVETMLKKLLTFMRKIARLISPVRKSHNTKKVMMTNNEVLQTIKSAPRFQLIYTRQDGRTNEYTVAITERNSDHIVGYKFQNGESCGIRRFNHAQIGSIELVS